MSPPKTSQDTLRHLPSVTEADKHLKSRGLPSGKAVRVQVERVLERFRAALRSGSDDAGSTDELRGRVLKALEAAVSAPPPGQLRRVINATGVVVHTNLGRAVLPAALTRAAEPLHHAYLNLEFDLETGKRGARGGRVPELLAQLAQAEDGVVVNNNAAAVLLMLTALAAGKEVIVSRGELVEIGGAFRVPDIMRQSGARLVEVGTTNRTRLSDYAQALTPETAAFLKVHRSNFHISGFTEEVGVPELAELAAEHGRKTGQSVGVWNDLGSGNFYRFSQPALNALPTVAQEVRAGADVVTLSGDKLLGSVQAGIVVGKAAPLGLMRRHPLYRSLRVDRVRIALLEHSLRAYLDVDTLREHNIVVDLLERTPEDMHPLAEDLLRALAPLEGRGVKWQLVRDQSLAGGGAVPDARIETLCLSLIPSGPGFTAQRIADGLRTHEPAVIARLAEDRVLLDFRTVFSQDVPDIASAIGALLGA